MMARPSNAHDGIQDRGEAGNRGKEALVTNVTQKRLADRAAIALSLSAMVLVGVGSLATTAHAAEAPAPFQASPQQLVADQWMLLAGQALTAQEQPSQATLKRVTVLLDQAIKLNETDAELWRLRAELARLSSDGPALNAALRQVTRLDPSDDAAQWKLILRAIEPLQTVQQRLAAVDRMLTGPGSEQFSAPLRSRLASYAAAAARESGDLAALSNYLKQATALDGSNLAAAQMVYDVLSSRQRPMVDVGSALLRVIEADPMQPAWRQRLAMLLASGCAYREAASQFRAANTLGQPITDPMSVYPWAMSLGASDRVDEALQIISQVRKAFTTSAVASTQPGASTQPAAGTAPTTQPATTAVSLPLPADLSLLQMVLLDMIDQKQSAEQVLVNVTAELRKDAASGSAEASATLAWVLALANRELPEAAKQLEIAGKTLGVSHPLLQRTSGWLALRGGDVAKARAILTPLAETDPFAAVGVAMSFTDVTERQQRQQWLTRAVTDAPVSLAALIAQRRLLEMGVRQVVTPDGQALANAFGKWQKWLLLPTPTSVTLVQLSAKVEASRPEYLQPIVAKLSFRNMTELPMSIEAGGPVPTRVVLVLSPRNGGKAMEPVAPLVVDLDRRLRLEPRAGVEVAVRLDRGSLGWVLSQNPTEPVSFSVTAVLDPVASGQQIRPGPMGQVEHVGQIDRRPLAVNGASIKQWIASLSAGSPAEKFTAAAALARSLEQGVGAAGEVSEEAKPVVAALNQSFAGLDPLLQAWTVRFLPSKAAGALGPVYDAVARSKDAMVRVAFLATQVTDPASPQIDAALRMADPQVKAFAAALRESLTAAAAKK
jgi:tetratricopeptide (TPR) repeat protein